MYAIVRWSQGKLLYHSIFSGWVNSVTEAHAFPTRHGAELVAGRLGEPGLCLLKIFSGR
jgi:hypothetical protein